MARILAIDTSCDETSAAVTEENTVLSNVVWSQASLHEKWGGVVPSIAKRAHAERIDWVVEKAIKRAFPGSQLTVSGLLTTKIDAVAVTVGPGLAIALEVGINKAKDIAKSHNKPFIAVNHIEGHVLSPLARPRKITNHKPQTTNHPPHSTHNTQPSFPALGLVTSGKHTDIISVEKPGKYKILASTVDDALGEALDKAARMLGFGYPGGHIVEELAKKGNPDVCPLPIPLLGQENRLIFSYSGIKAALFRKVEDLKKSKKILTRDDIVNIAASFQKSAFSHFLRVLEFTLSQSQAKNAVCVFGGGGVMANIKLRSQIRDLLKKYGLPVFYPYEKSLYGDNAAMIGVAANYKFERGEIIKNPTTIDRQPNVLIDQRIKKRRFL